MFIEKQIISKKVTVPPSKSLSHRALICAAMAEGQSVIENVNLCDDVVATARCLEKLGAEIALDGEKTTVKGTFPKGSAVLDCGESGSTMRMLMPLASLTGEKMIFTGAPRLLERPINIYEDIFLGQGRKFGVYDDRYEVEGALSGGCFSYRGNVSSQFTSGLMLAAPLMQGYSIIEPADPVVSRPYITLTAAVMRDFGIEISGEGNRIVIGEQKYRPTEYAVEGDWSFGANLFVMNELGHNIIIEGLERNSLQGDRAIKLLLGKLRRGCSEIDISDCPDLAPSLMAVAPLMYGCTLYGTDRLTDKECSRGEAMTAELEKFGVRCEMGENCIYIPPCRDFHAPTETVLSHNDHRIAMALFALLTLTSGEIDDLSCISKSAVLG